MLGFEFELSGPRRVASRDHVHIPSWCAPFNRLFGIHSTPREYPTNITMTVIKSVVVSITPS